VTFGSGTPNGCVTNDNLCFFEDSQAVAPIFVGFDPDPAVKQDLLFGVQNDSAVPASVKTSFPALLRSRSVNFEVMQLQYTERFVFNLLSPAGPWRNYVYVVQSEVQILCLGDYIGSPLACCLGVSPGQSASCDVRLSDCTVRTLQYDATTQMVSVNFQGSFVSAPLVNLNTTHSWADWQVTPLAGITNLSQAVTLQLQIISTDVVYSYFAVDNSGIRYGCQTAPTRLPHPYCFQRDSTGNIVAMGATTFDNTGLVYGDYFGNFMFFGLPNFPAKLLSDSINWSLSDSKSFVFGTTYPPPWVNPCVLYVLQSGPFFELCLQDVNDTFACCISSSACTARRADGTPVVLRLSSSPPQPTITIVVSGSYVTTPISRVNDTHSIGIVNIDTMGSGVTRLSQNITLVRSGSGGRRVR